MKTKSLLTLLGGLFFLFAKSQTAPSFTAGTRQSMAICQNSGINVIDSKLVTTDPDAGQNLTYTIAAAPIHGTVHGFPGLTSTGTGGIISPSGFDYAPANGYNGLDSFTVIVNDGTFSAQTKIVVTVNSLPTISAITGTASACIGLTSQLADATTAGVWSSSNVFVADISNAGLVTAQAAGTATISYTVTNITTGCSNASSVTFTVAGPPVVQAITGTTTVCAGSTTQLSSLTGGGVWTSNNTTRATINSSTGLVTGVNGGNVTITYTVTNGVGCSNFVTTSLTVNNRPTVNSINANTTTICVGSTTNLTIASTGGTWSSSSAAIATVSNVGGGGGTVTGVAAGIVYISYTITNANGCTAKDSVQMTVTTGVTVAPITGPTTVCTGKSITLADATSGGTWAVTTGGFRASITQAGVLTATNTAGAVTVSYSVTGGGGCSKTVTYNVTVSNAPTLSAISGSNQVCVGSTTALTNSTAGGTWTSSNTSFATVSTGGIVTGVAPGLDTIKYKVTNGAGCTDSVIFSITVTSSISVAPIVGASSVCMGATLLLTDATAGGTWNSSDLSIAAVVNGTVYPIAQGVVAITYTVGSGACAAVASKNVIIYESPNVGAITGNTAICVGITSQLSNTTTGGVWSTSNTNVAAISATGLITPANLNFSQNATITYTVTNSNGCTSTATTIVTVNPKPTVQPITGTNSTCVSSTTALSVSNPTGGVWATSDNTVAIVSPQTPNNNATVIGMGAGTSTITYSVTNGNGCSTVVSSLVTISPTLVVASIVGNSTVCIGVTPNPTYTCTTTGGTWTSNNTAVLNINTTSGAATGVAPGTATVTVTYTVNKGGTCVASSILNVTVANRPATPTVSGANAVCVNDSIQLTGNPAGGYWRYVTGGGPGLTFISVDSLTGWVKGLTATFGGGANVTYNVSNAAGCTRASNNFAITVNAGPTISNNNPANGTVCVGQTTNFTNSTAGGSWNSSNTAIVKINATTGIATGVATGNTVINYVVTNSTGCASAARSFTTVNTTPNSGTLSGQSSVCVGSTTTLVASVTGGSWSSSNTAVATVNNSGAVTGSGVGNCTISYTVTSGGGGGGGCSSSTTKSITVNAVPTVSSITSIPTGQNSLCINSTLQLANATSGGTWASSNNTRATVDATGLVTGVGAGAIIITYTVTNGTCSATAFGNGTVYALPTVAAISGSSSVCVGSTINLTNDTTGGVWSSSDNALATIDASGVVTGVAAGSVVISYSKTNSNGCIKIVTKAVTINALPTIAVITGNAPICVGSTNTLASITTGGTWFSANISIATITSSGVVSGVSAGVAIIRYIVTNANGCMDSVSATVTVNALPLVATIGGSNAVCVGSITSLTNSTGTGVWTSSNSSVATITNGGVVSGITIGTTIIKYQVTNASGCVDSSTTTLTVNALPTVAAITGNTPVCEGSTRTLTNATTGGVWTSSNTIVATVNASGVVLGVSAGASTIKYQVTNASGCIDSAITTITVNALPIVAALTGTNTVCVGLTTTYSSINIGGVWSTSNAAIATVAGGVITGVAAGTATISYSITNVDGCTKTVTKTVTVNALPTVAAITGSSSVCIGSTTTYTSTPTTGVWTSDNTTVATIGSTTGIVMGVAAGTATITYTVSNANGCIKSDIKIITVNALPTAAFTINNNSQCVNTNSFVFTNTSIGAASSSWNFGDATTSTSISPTKVYSTAGTFNVKLVVTNSTGCKDSVTQSVTIKATSTSTTNISICPSALPYTWNGLTFTAAGSQTAHLTNSVGCDSAATLNLTVKTNTSSTQNIAICPSALPYTWNSLTFTAAGSQTKTGLVNSQGCDSSATLNLIVKTNTSSTQNIAICPSNLPYLWNGLTFTAAGSQTKTGLVNSQGCDSSATLNLTVKTNTSSTQNISICPSALPYLWNGLTFTAAGSQTKTGLVNSQGCDSSATLNLTVKTNTSSTQNIAICPSALPYTWNSLTFTAAGSQTKTGLVNSQGCDSSATLNLTVKTNTSSTQNISICPSSLPYVWNGLTFTATSSQTKTGLVNSQGCDSSATLNLTVKTNTSSTQNIAICPSALPYSWNGLTFNAAGSQTKTGLVNSQGCDSSATLNLTVKTNTSSTQSIAICPSALPYSWNGLTFNAAGSQTATLTNAVGCDSAATLNLTLKTNTTSTINKTACNTFTWNGVTHTTSGVYTFNTTNSQGCDSVATLNLTVNFASTSTTNHTACNSYTWNGITYTTSGVYTFTSPNAVGCDSVATLNLTVNYASTSTTNHTGCNSYLWNGTTYTTSGFYTFTSPNAVGCDSVATLNLTVNYSSTSTTNHTACNTYTWNGTNYTTSGVYTFTSTNAKGCDSVATLNLIVNYSSVSTTNHTACNSYLWNGTTYTTSGVYTFTTANAVGCDSVATLNLTVNYSSTSTTNHTACNSYLWNGTTYTTSGVYTFTSPNAVGCDSVATLNLTVNYASTSTTNHTACNSHLWNGTTYSTSGVYTFTSTNAKGCDSVATLNLTVNYSSTSTTNLTACNTYLWNGTTYTISGVYTFTSPNAVGCDSVATLNLVVNYSSTSSTNKTICVSELPFVWNGLTFNAAGSQTANFTNAVGCDSTATLNLTVNANPIVPAINGTKSVCVNGTTPLSNTTASGVWSSSNTTAATIDNAGVVSGLSAGTSTISYIVTNANNCSTTASALVTVNALPTVAAITGSNQVCVTSTKVLGNATTGGVWSSLTPAIATVTSAGVVGGVSVGGTTIKYTVTDVLTGCSNSTNHILTVNSLPTITPITGINTVCVGATTTLSTTTVGGSWNSNNSAIASVDVNGIVTGVASGVTIINCTVNDVTTGCQSTVSTSVTVNALPTLGSINGSSTVCVNSTTTLSNTTTGGTWSSSDAAVAIIDNVGIITALTAGTTTIKYIVSNGSGCIDSVSKIITVNDNPAVTAITAAQSVCVGSNITASNITPNGIWTIGNSAFATIDASGLITGLADGVTFITYTVTDVITNCSAKISSPLIVNVPAVAPIIGVNALCPASTSILSTTTTGGVWSSTDPSIATVDLNGLVTAIANGTTTISYKVPVGNACGDSASTIVTVNTTLSIAPITGDSTVCNGSSSTLASVTLGGTWTSSNTAVATINATTGVVSTLSAGTSTITYSVASGAGCNNTLTTTFTVDALPATPDFTLASSSCVGSSLTLTPTVIGGFWSSSNASVASVDATGNLTGVSVGTANITYTLTNAAGCSTSVSKSININILPVVAAITGSSTFCVGSSITLANDSVGGVWSSNNASVLNIDANSGIVTSAIAGTAIFSYTVTNVAGCVTIVTKSVTAFDVPTVDPIVGGNSVCVGSNITLASPTSNGVWTSLTPFVASINNTGVLTGNANGGTTIKYTVTDALTTCSNFASLIVTVNPLPIVPAITGANAVCLNSSTTLSNTTTGGTWSSNNTSVATINNIGLVNGVGAGTATITYNVVNASGCSTAVTFDVTVNIQTTSSTTQTSCNSYLWNGTNYTTSGTYTFNTTNANGCDSAATLNLTINYSTSSNTSQTACNSFTWNGTTYTTSGQYYFASTNASGCTNTDTLNLTINYSTSSNTSQTACNSFTWNGTTYTTSGQYYFASTNASGCSNTDTLNLTINYSTSSNTSQTACNSFTWNGTTYTTGGQYYFASINASGCSNIDTLNLTINNSTSSNTSQTACNSFTWNGTTYTTSGQYYFASTNASGCSNIDTLNLTINYSTSSNTSQTACNSYTWNGTTYITSGQYYFASTNASGCINTDTLNLTINYSTSSNTSQTACNSYTWNGTTYITSGQYYFASTNASGCINTDTLNLTINYSTSSNTSQTACNSYTWNGTTYTTSGQYYFASTNASGCSNTDTLNLTINYSTSSNTSQTACNSYTWNGTTYTTSGQYYFASTNSSGCSNTDTLNLIINYSTSSNTSQTACNSYTWNGTTYTTSGQYYFASTNASGCSNTDTLNLTINYLTSSNTSQSACDSYIWNGTTYTASGQYYFNSTNAGGCSNTDTLNLTIKVTPASPSITSSSLNVTIPATAVVYGCSTVANATNYTWSYTGTGVTIASGQGTENITADFAANATNGDIQVVASNATCSSAPTTASIILPTTLNNFVVIKANKTALVKWTTATEINSKNFEVQRSIDGRNFVTIGTITAKGFASEYSFVDDKPFTGVNYYRLKQVDNDGKFALSVVKTINLNSNEIFNVSIYPNPATNVLNIKVANGDAKQVRMFNSLGKTVYTTIENRTSYIVNLTSLSSGTYFVEILTNDGRREVEKFIKN